MFSLAAVAIALVNGQMAGQAGWARFGLQVSALAIPEATLDLQTVAPAV